MSAVRRFAALADEIRLREPQCGRVRLVAIDGPGGAGKSVFAGRLAMAIDGAPVVATDDFAAWDNAIDWWARFERDVLGSLERGEPVRYRAVSWTPSELGEDRVIEPTDVVLIEGVGSARRRVASRLSFAIWIETPRDERLHRGLARDGEPALPQWEKWMAGEDRHFALDRTIERADLIVDGMPSEPHDGAAEFVVADALSGPRSDP